MKHVLITMCALVLAIACTKTEVNYDFQQVIAFAPVSSTITKAALASGSTPTTDLIVTANAGLDTDKDATVELSECETVYFENVTFTKGNDNVFTASDCFWPNVKYLSFAGVTASSGVEQNNVSIDVDGNTVTVTDYIQQEFNIVNNDLMWFPATMPAGKESGNIVVSMYHALSWLVFNFKGDGVSGGTNPWKITKIDVVALSDKETATLTNNSAEWTENGTIENGTKKLFNVYTGRKTDVYATTEGLELEDCTGTAGDVVTPENDVLVIPQTPCNLSVEYQYEIDGNTITETATASLNYNASNKWASGKKYIYNILIGADPIKIEASAGEWYDDLNGDADGNGQPDQIDL